MGVVIKKYHTVKPAGDSRTSINEKDDYDQIMFMSDCDQLKPLTHAPTIYIYKKPTPEISLQDAINILKDSLSKALVKFYPLAGRLHWIPGGGGRVELHCNYSKGGGASVIEAESSDLKIDDLGNDFLPSPVISSLLPSVDLVNTPIQDVPLLLVQLTKFACGGLTLGVMISHILVDGRSALCFMSEWAKLAHHGNEYQYSDNPLPFFDRNILRAKLHSNNAKELMMKYSHFHPLPRLIGVGEHSGGMDQRRKPTRVVALKIGNEQIEKLKSKANLIENQHKTLNIRSITRFESLSSHIWRCATKARNHVSDQETLCFITVDFRNRLKPPLPEAYFGNAVMMVPATATAEELLSKPLSYAALKIRETIESVTDEYVNDYLDKCKNLPDVSVHRHSHSVGCSKGAFLGNPNLLITSWSGLNLYGLDFGWGGESYLGPASVGYDGRIVMVPRHAADGSFLVIMRFQVEYLDAFVKYFYEDI